jgi:hypothetical protein
MLQGESVRQPYHYIRQYNLEKDGQFIFKTYSNLLCKWYCCNGYRKTVVKVYSGRLLQTFSLK